MKDVSPESPEERAKRRGAEGPKRPGKARRIFNRHIGPGTYPFVIAKRVLLGVYAEGFIHAGNLAYLAILTLFPFFIVAAAVARLLGRTQDGLHTVEAFLRTVPPSVANVLQQPIHDVLAARSGGLLWLGAIVGLWTTASFIETIRDILRRAYGTQFGRPFWEYRLGSIGLIIGAVVMAMIAFSFQVALLGIEQFVLRVLPFASGAAAVISVTRIAPGFALFGALYVLFYTLTPRKYRESKCPKWPGAALTACWWIGTTGLMPVVLGRLGSYDLTYGSLAGVMIALIFFFFVGLGVVVGAQLNAALAETPHQGLEDDQGNPIHQEKAAA